MKLKKGKTYRLTFPKGEIVAKLHKRETYLATGMPDDLIFEYVSGSDALVKATGWYGKPDHPWSKEYEGMFVLPGKLMPMIKVEEGHMTKSSRMIMAEGLVNEMTESELRDLSGLAQRRCSEVLKAWRRSCRLTISHLPLRKGDLIFCPGYSGSQGRKFYGIRRRTPPEYSAVQILGKSHRPGDYPHEISFHSVTSIRRGSKVLYQRVPLSRFKLED